MNAVEAELHQPLVAVEHERFGRLQTDADVGIILLNIRFQLAKPSFKVAAIEDRLGCMEDQEHEMLKVGVFSRTDMLLFKIF